MGSINEINLKNCTYYFCSEMDNIRKFGSNLLKIEKNTRTGILIFITLNILQ